MKLILFILFLSLSLFNNVYSAEADFRYFVSAESLENGKATIVGMRAGDEIFYGGLSLSHIKSTEVIQYDGRKSITPLYLFLGLKANMKISPFIETGMDLPEAIIDDLLNNEEKSEAQADYYFSTGIYFEASKTTVVSLYAKKYNFKYRETILSPTIKNRPSAYGISLQIKF